MRLISLAAALLIFGVTAAWADERLLDGALGGLAGAVALGPVGLVGGALIGATAGPAISTSWGLSGRGRAAYRHSYRHRRTRSSHS